MKAYKYRIYPTDPQKVLLAKHFGSKRFIYNKYLAENNSRFERNEKHLSPYDVNLLITQDKKCPETAWLKEIDSTALQCASIDLGNAYSNFFNSIKGKRKGKKVERPRFKKRSSRQSYRTMNARIVGGKLLLPKFKESIKTIFHRQFPDAAVKSATISKTPSGKYFVSLLVEEDISLNSQTGLSVGIDLGIKELMIMSNGIKVKNPKFLSKTKKKLGREQRILSRKIKGSSNYDKQRIKVAKLHEKVANQRKDLYHKISKHLVDEYDLIIFESLNVKGMIKNHCLSSAIHDASWSTLLSMIEYKCNWYGKTFHKID